MKALHPQLAVVSRGTVAVIWRGALQPAPLCEQYVVEIAYSLEDRPLISVLSPALQRRGDSKIPHTFAEDRPCVYLPGNHEWDASKYIAHTIVPWLSLWLFFYEAWLATGVWLGGGYEPPSGAEGP